MGGHRKCHPGRDWNSDQHLAVCEVRTTAPCGLNETGRPYLKPPRCSPRQRPATVYGRTSSRTMRIMAQFSKLQMSK
jgi:hypothetical protein